MLFSRRIRKEPLSRHLFKREAGKCCGRVWGQGPSLVFKQEGEMETKRKNWEEIQLPRSRPNRSHLRKQLSRKWILQFAISIWRGDPGGPDLARSRSFWLFLRKIVNIPIYQRISQELSMNDFFFDTLAHFLFKASSRSAIQIMLDWIGCKFCLHSKQQIFFSIELKSETVYH